MGRKKRREEEGRKIGGKGQKKREREASRGTEKKKGKKENVSPPHNTVHDRNGRWGVVLC